MVYSSTRLPPRRSCAVLIIISTAGCAFLPTHTYTLRQSAGHVSPTSAQRWARGAMKCRALSCSRKEGCVIIAESHVTERLMFGSSCVDFPDGTRLPITGGAPSAARESSRRSTCQTPIPSVSSRRRSPLTRRPKRTRFVITMDRSPARPLALMGRMAATRLGVRALAGALAGSRASCCCY